VRQVYVSGELVYDRADARAEGGVE
jgi:hypothetical protein